MFIPFHVSAIIVLVHMDTIGHSKIKCVEKHKRRYWQKQTVISLSSRRNPGLHSRAGNVVNKRDYLCATNTNWESHTKPQSIYSVLTSL